MNTRIFRSHDSKFQDFPIVNSTFSKIKDRTLEWICDLKLEGIIRALRTARNLSKSRRWRYPITRIPLHEQEFTPLGNILDKIQVHPVIPEIRLEKSIEIIIPVYNGMEYLPSLFKSVLRDGSVPYRVIVVDDCSTDDRVVNYLRSLRVDHSNREIIVVRNDRNLGFVRSVNKGAALTSNHFIILNSDVEVPEHWIERMIYPMIIHENIASVTPCTNAGTISSFPDFLVDNALFENLPASVIDKAFSQVSAEEFVEAPTGVGFCMAFNRDVVRRIGMFDELTFGQGYGEENDWCQRAIKAGYKNVLINNLFVYHKHGGSFEGRKRKHLMTRNMRSLLRKHPKYLRDIHAFIRNDPQRLMRDALIFFLAVCAANPSRPVLVLDHQEGEGVNPWKEKAGREMLRLYNKILILNHVAPLDRFLIELRLANRAVRYQAHSLGEVKQLFDSITFREIILGPGMSPETASDSFSFLMNRNDLKISRIGEPQPKVYPTESKFSKSG